MHVGILDQDQMLVCGSKWECIYTDDDVLLMSKMVYLYRSYGKYSVFL